MAMISAFWVLFAIMGTIIIVIGDGYSPTLVAERAKR
jgi:hypothetical protein